MSTVEVTLDALFQGGKLRLEDRDDGWAGFRRETDEDEPAYYYVDTSSPVEMLRSGVRVGEESVRNAVSVHYQEVDSE